MSTGNGVLDLVAACYRQALKDAQAGHYDAVRFLDETAPGWRQFVSSQPKRTRTRDPTGQGQMGMDAL